MNEVFADTSGWANYFVRTEPFHQDAKELVSNGIKIKFVSLQQIISFRSLSPCS